MKDQREIERAINRKLSLAIREFILSYDYDLPFVTDIMNYHTGEIYIIAGESIKDTLDGNSCGHLIELLNPESNWRW